MILKDSDITARLESPLNLINRLNRVNPKSSSMDIFVPSQIATDESDDDNPVDQIIDDQKLRLGLVRNLALDVLHDSISSLKLDFPKVSKIKDLSSIARDMKVILTEDEGSAKTMTQIVIYKPIVNDISKYETLVVME